MKIHSLRIAFAATALALLACAPVFAGMSEKDVVCPVQEECLSYDFADLQYVFTSFEDDYDDAHGVALNLSKSLTDVIYATLYASWSGTEAWSEDVDLAGASGGLGYVIPLNSKLHLNVEAGGTYGYSSGPWASEDSWGWFVGPGFRCCVTQDLELFANVYYVRFSDGYDVWDTNVGLLYDLTDRLALKVAGELNEDDQSVMVGLRCYY